MGKSWKRIKRLRKHNTKNQPAVAVVPEVAPAPPPEPIKKIKEKLKQSVATIKETVSKKIKND